MKDADFKKVIIKTKQRENYIGSALARHFKCSIKYNESDDLKNLKNGITSYIVQKQVLHVEWNKVAILNAMLEIQAKVLYQLCTSNYILI